MKILRRIADYIRFVFKAVFWPLSNSSLPDRVSMLEQRLDGVKGLKTPLNKSERERRFFAKADIKVILNRWIEQNAPEQNMEDIEFMISRLQAARTQGMLKQAPQQSGNKFNFGHAKT